METKFKMKKKELIGANEIAQIAQIYKLKVVE
jgi:hypothetical protein